VIHSFSLLPHNIIFWDVGVDFRAVNDRSSIKLIIREKTFGTSTQPRKSEFKYNVQQCFILEKLRKDLGNDGDPKLGRRREVEFIPRRSFDLRREIP
jgi:hypothetical protein